jgi:error-prone DNA polymerase
VPERVCGLLRHELELIEELRYEAYFLTVWDLVRFARSRGILCQGRGSAANSAVCYCLGVTAVDPERADVLFERFVSRERDEAPDIDVDFEHERREEVLQYLYEKYGRERAGMTAEVIRYRTRSAVRDVGKALGLSLDRVDALAKNIEGYHHEPHLEERCREVGIDPGSELGRRLVYLVNELVGFPRHLSQHVGGMVMTQGPLCELVPIENAAMDGRTVIQWDKDDLDELGILKVDCLALGMLTAIRRGFELIKGSTGRELTLASIPEGDQAVYEMICQADTMGVFQIESRAQMSMLPRLKPRCYYDLVIEVAIVRPGPIQGNMVHPYLRRRSGEELVQYPNEAIREVLKKTLGVPIFQEQAMRLAVVAAGFTPGEADQLRRAMGAWRRPGLIDQFRKKLIDGMRARGLAQEFAEQVFHQIRGFGEYGFPESHAASFALLVYVSAWLKHYYPAAFAAALINSQPMGFYAPAQLVRDAHDHGVEVRPADVNFSQWDCALEMRNVEPLENAECGMRNAELRRSSERIQSDGVASPVPSSAFRIPNSAFLRLGLRMIRGLSQGHAEAIVAARRKGPFRSVEEFTRRTRLGQAVLSRLAHADALKSLGRDRRDILWETLAQEKTSRPMPLFEGIQPEDEPAVDLPPMHPQQEVFADYQSTGLSLKRHPISFYREDLNCLRVTPADQLPELRNNTPVRVAGLVLLRQRPSTAKGITFVTLEDETGVINLVVHQKVWQRYYQVARRAAGMIAYGTIESKYSVIHVVVRRLEDLSGRLKQLGSKSRDFR